MGIVMAQTIDDMTRLYPVLSTMYPNLSETAYVEALEQKITQGYRMISFEENKEILGALGYWIGIRFYCGPFLQIDNLVVHPEHRSKDIGRMLVSWCIDKAKTNHCQRVILDTYVENFPAHQFFHRLGFINRGYHMNLELT